MFLYDIDKHEETFETLRKSLGTLPVRVILCFSGVTKSMVMFSRYGKMNTDMDPWNRIRLFRAPGLVKTHMHIHLPLHLEHDSIEWFGIY